MGHKLRLSLLALAISPSCLILQSTNCAVLAGQEQSAISKPVASQPVHDSMATIRSIVRNNHSLITHRRLGVAQAQEMSYQIKQEIENIQAQESDTKLALKLEPILQKINEGVEAVAAPSESLSRIDGLFQIDSALTDYGTAIDDPKWQGLRTQ